LLLDDPTAPVAAAAMALAFLAKRAGFSRDAVAAEDHSGCSPMQGWLSKRSSRGIYQRRYL
jgi:hypothetical protein